jgi:hypothetical protein
LTPETIVLATILRLGEPAFDEVSWKLDPDDLTGDPLAALLFEIVTNLEVAEPIRAGVERTLAERGITVDLDEYTNWALPSLAALPRLCEAITEKARRRRQEFLERFARASLRAEAQHALWAGRAA